MKKCELLVPAGGVDQFMAAVENGADAIYVGGRSFNARINAGNFDDDTLTEAVKFAHRRGIKVYVTMNTLIMPEEMKEAVKYAAFLYEIGVDALIVQDWGLGFLLRESMPDFPLHLSTQATVYDIEGVKGAAALGYERVVLARELSLGEIQEVCKSSPIEIEVFVHGALCLCYSGQCQLSRYNGGRSGNRGQCAQPCRMAYKSFDSSGRILETVNHPLSPKDICYIDHLCQLVDGGVNSLKIEGRMKSAHYVAVVTSIYRKYLDMYYSRGAYEVSKSDREKLEQVFNRGGFSEGYLFGNPKSKLITPGVPKHRGIKIGKVVKRVPGKSLIDVSLDGQLSIGDGVEVQGETLIGNVVTYCRKLDNGLTRIGDIKGKVTPGAPLYRITSKALKTEAEAAFAHKNFEQGKYKRRLPLDMRLTLSDKGAILDGVVKMDGITPWGGKLTASVCRDAFDRTAEREGCHDRIKKALRKTGNSPFAADEISVVGDRGWHVPMSAINQMRRDLTELLESSLASGRTKPQLPVVSNSKVSGRAEVVELYFYTWEGMRRYKENDEIASLGLPVVKLIPITDFVRHCGEIGTDEKIIPYVSNVSKGRETLWLKEHIDSVAEHCRSTGIYVGNIGEINILRRAGVPIYGDFGLNVCNIEAQQALESLGVKHCTNSLELQPQGLGAIPLMVSEHTPQGAYLMDGKNRRMRVTKRGESSQCILTPDESEIDRGKLLEYAENGGPILRIYVL